jgi:hypothetical protein
MTKNVQSS